MEIAATIGPGAVACHVAEREAVATGRKRRGECDANNPLRRLLRLRRTKPEYIPRERDLHRHSFAVKNVFTL